MHFFGRVIEGWDLGDFGLTDAKIMNARDKGLYGGGLSQETYAFRTEALKREHIQELMTIVTPFFETERWLLHGTLDTGVFADANFLLRAHQMRPKVLDQIAVKFEELILEQGRETVVKNYTHSDADTVAITITVQTYAPRALPAHMHMSPNIAGVNVNFQFSKDKPISQGGHFSFIGNIKPITNKPPETPNFRLKSDYCIHM
ncbi:hypothetical protein AAMO2058_000267700 [Amorphochlora amoebiformis]